MHWKSAMSDDGLNGCALLVGASSTETATTAAAMMGRWERRSSSLLGVMDDTSEIGRALVDSLDAARWFARV
jgi:hypothetical protein